MDSNVATSKFALRYRDDSQEPAKMPIADMYDAIEKHNESLRKFDVVEKLDRVIYVPGRFPGAGTGFLDDFELSGDHNVRIFSGREDNGDRFRKLRGDLDKDSLFALEFPGRTFDLNGGSGDAASISAIIRNSEVGMRSVQIWGGISRFFCTNQLHSSDTVVRIPHLGEREVRLKMIRDGISEAIGKTDELVEEFRNSLTRSLSDPVASLLDIGKEVGFGDRFLERAGERWKNEGENPRVFDVVNAITREAQEIESFDERHETERLAGDILPKLNKLSLAS